MGFGSMGPWQLLIILAIVIVVFGTKRLKSLGGDVGSAIKSFRKAMETDDDKGKSGSDADAEHHRIESGKGSEPDAEFSEQADKEKHG
jgi:sec-independent protein translocase protein TatA